MKTTKILLIISSILLSSCCTKKEAKDFRPDFVKENMSLVWSDEFDGKDSEPNGEFWDYNTGGHGWGNGERQNYTKERKNSFVSDGTLKITALKGSDGKWTSARLVSSFKKNFTYGYIEFRAKLPVEKGSWPALWLMPQFSGYGNWPRSGEIDVMEYASSTWGKKAYGTVHCKAGSGGNAISSGFTQIKDASKWHNYAVLWQEDSITWYYDGKLINEYKNPEEENEPWAKWPFDKPFYIIMNVAMGGTLGGDIPKNLSKCQMEVDYVRVYQ
jgi:beta-glucanase (GH16 family)